MRAQAAVNSAYARARRSHCRTRHFLQMMVRCAIFDSARAYRAVTRRSRACAVTCRCARLRHCHAAPVRALPSRSSVRAGVRYDDYVPRGRAAPARTPRRTEMMQRCRCRVTDAPDACACENVAFFIIHFIAAGAARAAHARCGSVQDHVKSDVYVDARMLIEPATPPVQREDSGSMIYPHALPSIDLIYMPFIFTFTFTLPFVYTLCMR